MSCNCTCNTTSKCNNDPCAICTPPGVTGLTTCYPVDPCDQKINIDCVNYNGIDFSCLNVKNGDQLIDVLLAILNYYFPPSYCCQMDISVTVGIPSSTTTTTTTTSSTTTSTSTTTTTTTAVPNTKCMCYHLTNTTGTAINYSFINCDRIADSSSVSGLSDKYQCAIQKSIVVIQPGIIIDELGLCNAGCPPLPPTTTTTTSTTSTTSTSTSTTTTTTTICKCFQITNPTNTVLYYSYDSCGDNPNNFVPPNNTPLAGGATDYFCAKPGTVVIDPGLNFPTLVGDCTAGCPPNTPPNIDCTETENFVVYNGSSQNIINDIVGVFFAWPGGPVLPNDVVKGIHGSFTGTFTVNITFAPGSPVGCLKVFVNGILQSSSGINTSGSYILDIATGDGDCVQIILTDNPC